MEIVSRNEALFYGVKKYFTGNQCSRGHIAERYVVSHVCIECSKIHNAHTRSQPDKLAYYTELKRQDRIDHPEKRKAYRDANTDKIKIYNQKFRDTHPEYRDNYRKNNPEIISKCRLKRRVCERQASPLWYEKELISTLYKKRDELSELWGIQLHVDHIVPLQGKTVCGLHCWDNLQLIEGSLNQTKSNKFKG